MFVPKLNQTLTIAMSHHKTDLFFQQRLEDTDKSCHPVTRRTLLCVNPEGNNNNEFYHNLEDFMRNNSNQKTPPTPRYVDKKPNLSDIKLKHLQLMSINCSGDSCVFLMTGTVIVKLNIQMQINEPAGTPVYSSLSGQQIPAKPKTS